MPANRNLDIRGIDWPICILNCKKEVDQLKAGERLDVLVNDIDVLNNLIAFLEQLSNHKIVNQKKNQYHRIIITKTTRTVETDDDQTKQ